MDQHPDSEQHDGTTHRDGAHEDRNQHQQLHIYERDEQCNEHRAFEQHVREHGDTAQHDAMSSATGPSTNSLT
eukprot:2322016-Pyramimonas_sp.AAC.1